MKVKKLLGVILSVVLLTQPVSYASDYSLVMSQSVTDETQMEPATSIEISNGNHPEAEMGSPPETGSPSETKSPSEAKGEEPCNEQGNVTDAEQLPAFFSINQLRATYGAVYYQGDWDWDVIQNAVKIPQVYPGTIASYCPSLPVEAMTSSLYQTYGPNGCADVQISVGSGNNGVLNRKEVTVNMKPGQLLILRPMGASKHSYAYTSYINDNRGRRFSDFAKVYHSSDSHYSRMEYAWLMRVSCDMAGNWDAHAVGWNTVNNEGDRIYYGPAHWTMHLNVAHDYGAWYTAAEPSCVVQGTQKRVCKECGSVETRATSALGHAFSDGYYMGANDGTYFRRCTRPGCDSRTDVKYNSYTIMFDANGGTGIMNSQPFVFQTPDILLKNQYVKDYHTFKEWNTAADGSGGAYGDGQSVLNLTKMYGDTVTLYAQWIPNTYTITFDDGADGTQTQNQACMYTKKLGPLPEYKRKGYSFEGFYTRPDGGEKIGEETEVPHQDTTYYARWSANKYQLEFHTNQSDCETNKKQVVYNQPIGTLPVPVLEDYRFVGWFTQPYENGYQEDIMYGETEPPYGQRIAMDDIYQTDGDSNVYAYFVLVFENQSTGINLRPGKDGIMETADDNLYLNGPDQTAGTRDDQKIYAGEDERYGTKDDYYLDEEERRHYPGPDLVFGTEDDYRDDGNGSNTRPGPDCQYGTGDDISVSNGIDGRPGTEDDWLDNSKMYSATNRRPGPDGIFGTKDDEIWFDGMDHISGTKDDIRIYAGLDGEFGTMDDWYDNQESYPSTNIRPGQDGIFGSADDEIWFNGTNKIPGDADDVRILTGPDGEYGTEDDCYDNSQEQAGTNIRPGTDGIFGTSDDELWLNGPDQTAGTEDDIKYVPHHSGGASGGNQAGGKGAYKPYVPWTQSSISYLSAELLEIVASIPATEPKIVVLAEPESTKGGKVRESEKRVEQKPLEPEETTEAGIKDIAVKEEASKMESEEEEVNQGNAVLTVIVVLFIILLILYLVRKVSSHWQKEA